MMIIGCDLHTRYQQIAMLDTDTGELVERRLEHESGEARAFYVCAARARCEWGSKPRDTRTGSRRCWRNWGTSCGWAMRRRFGRRWCASRRRMRGTRRTCWICCARIAFRTIWRPSPAERDLRQLVWHRQKLVWMRGAVKNQMHALAMGEGVCRKKKLFTAKGRKELEGLALGPWASYRRQELLRMFDELQRSTTKLDLAVEQAAKNQPLAVRLMTHPGVGPITSLAFVLIIGPVERFERSKQVVSYLGLNPQEHSSGGKQRLGSISKQGNPMMRSLLVEAGSHGGALRSRNCNACINV